MMEEKKTETSFILFFPLLFLMSRVMCEHINAPVFHNSVRIPIAIAPIHAHFDMWDGTKIKCERDTYKMQFKFMSRIWRFGLLLDAWHCAGTYTIYIICNNKIIIASEFTSFQFVGPFYCWCCPSSSFGIR